MTTSRLFPAVNGPASATSGYTGPFIAGVVFRCLGPRIQWFEGHWVWVPDDGDTAPRTCALWVETGAAAVSLVGGSAVTSGILTRGKWNFVPVGAPFPLSLGTAYVAAQGWTVSAGFPDTQNQFSAGGPYASGLTSGSLFAYSDATAGGAAGTGNPVLGNAQGLFTTASANASAVCPNAGSDSANFWADIQVSDTAPDGHTGPWDGWANNVIGNQQVTADLNRPYNVGAEFALSSPQQVLAIGYITPAGATQLADRASIWAIDETGLVRTEIPGTVMSSPSWSQAAGAGTWALADYESLPALAAGKYVVAVANTASDSSDIPGWNAKDSETQPWTTGALSSGIQAGPLSYPSQADASACYDYLGSATAATPPYSAGTTEPGQSVFGQEPDGTLGPPYLYAGDPDNQNYFVKVITQDVPPVTGSGSITAAAAAVSGTGTETFTGSGSLTAPGAALSGSGAVSAAPAGRAVAANWTVPKAVAGQWA